MPLRTIFCCLLLGSTVALAQPTVRVSTDAPTTFVGDTVYAQVLVASSPDEIGSMLGTILWDEAHLALLPLTEIGTSFNGLTNDESAGDGQLVFNAVNPFGTAQEETVLNLAFRVLGFSPTDSIAIGVTVEEMYATQSYRNLTDEVQLAGSQLGKGFSVAISPSLSQLGLQVFPLPFRDELRVSYQLPQTSPVKVEVYDPLGQQVALIYEGLQSAGFHTHLWRPTADVTDGIYALRFQVNELIQVENILFKAK